MQGCYSNVSDTSLRYPRYSRPVAFRRLHTDLLLVAEVPTDAKGVCSHTLREMLENWPTGKPKPKVLYTVPVSYYPRGVLSVELNDGQYGCNPTGMTAAVERRLEVLELAREHNFIILEGTLWTTVTELLELISNFHNEQMIHITMYTTAMRHDQHPTSPWRRDSRMSAGWSALIVSPRSFRPDCG